MVVVFHEGFWEQITEYFLELFNFPPLSKLLACGGPNAGVALDPPNMEDPPSCQQVESVVSEHQ